MTVEFNPGDEWALVADGVETVVWKRPWCDGSQTLTKALRRPGRSRSTRSPADACARLDADWLLSHDEMPEQPQVGDVLTDSDGRRWAVLRVETSVVLQAWRCRCRDLIRYHRLYEYVDVERASYTVNDTGEEQAAWRLWRAGIPARWERRQSRTDHRHGGSRTEKTALVYVSEPLILDHTYRVRRHDGALFRVHSSQAATEPGEPSQIVVEPIGEDD